MMIRPKKSRCQEDTEEGVSLPELKPNNPALADTVLEMSRRTFLSKTLGWCAGTCLTLQAEYSNAQTKTTTNSEYAIMLPRNYDVNREYPLLFCLQPQGNGQDYLRVLTSLSAASRCIVAASNKYRNGLEFDEFVPAVIKAIDDIKAHYKVVKGKVVLCGLSGGGMAAYVIAHQHPEGIAGVIVNCGSIHPSVFKNDEHRGVGIRKAALVFGEADRVIPPDIIRRDAKLLEKAGVMTKTFGFRGGHTYAPAGTYLKALQWIEAD
jgi:pimeloyl-ACP methyl ester carboxylesterase